MSFANTPEGKEQAKRLTECRLALGCLSAKDFFNQYNKGLFSYPQYQKYESGERLLGRKAAILFAKIFNVDWEWLQNGTPADDEEFKNMSDDEKEIVRNYRKFKKIQNIEDTKAG